MTLKLEKMQYGMLGGITFVFFAGMIAPGRATLFAMTIVAISIFIDLVMKQNELSNFQHKEVSTENGQK